MCFLTLNPLPTCIAQGFCCANLVPELFGNARAIYWAKQTNENEQNAKPFIIIDILSLVLAVCFTLVLLDNQLAKQMHNMQFSLTQFISQSC